MCPRIRQILTNFDVGEVSIYPLREGCYKLGAKTKPIPFRSNLTSIALKLSFKRSTPLNKNERRYKLQRKIVN